jgi:hypothetical protein
MNECVWFGCWRRKKKTRGGEKVGTFSSPFLYLKVSFWLAHPRKNLRQKESEKGGGGGVSGWVKLKHLSSFQISSSR